MSELLNKKCVPCEGGVAAMTASDVQSMMKQIPQWTVGADVKTIKRSFTFKNFVTAMTFVNHVAELAEDEGHHPDILIHGYKYVDITLSTHSIGGLSENDFILATKIDQL